MWHFRVVCLDSESKSIDGKRWETNYKDSEAHLASFAATWRCRATHDIWESGTLQWPTMTYNDLQWKYMLIHCINPLYTTVIVIVCHCMSLLLLLCCMLLLLYVIVIVIVLLIIVIVCHCYGYCFEFHCYCIHCFCILYFSIVIVIVSIVIVYYILYFSILIVFFNLLLLLL